MVQPLLSKNHEEEIPKSSALNSLINSLALLSMHKNGEKETKNCKKKKSSEIFYIISIIYKF